MRRPYQRRAAQTAAIVTAHDLAIELGRARGTIGAGLDRWTTEIAATGERDHASRHDRVAVRHYKPRTRRTIGT